MGGLCATNNTRWLESCKLHKVDYVEKNIFAYSNTYEHRPYSLEKYIFTGFAAIHYAAYFGHIEIVLLLVD